MPEDFLIKQSIIIKKTHPDVHNRKDAEKIARKYADRIYTSRETQSSYRFRQRPVTDFDRESLRVEHKGKHISIIWGNLKK